MAEKIRFRQLNLSNQHLLLMIIGLAALLRIAFLGTAPISFSVDEASHAYDAYSILETQRDRYGEFLPLFTRAYDDYIETILIFLLVPFIKTFGLNEFAVRLCPAIIGTITVVIVYYLAQEFFKDNKLALISALFIAINPWHIFFSRLVFRANILPLLFNLALLFFLKSFQRPKYLPLSSLLFGLSLYTYHSARVFVPLFLLGLVIIFWQQLWKVKKQTIIAFILFMLIFIPLFLFWITPEGIARANDTGIETNPLQLISNYLSYFDPVFLFLRGDPNPRRSVATWGVGELYLFEFFTVLCGIWFLRKESQKERNILFLWLSLYPIPAALTESYHAIRSIVGVPLFAIISAYGLFKIQNLLSYKQKKYFKFIFPLIITISLTLFLKFYFNYSQYKIAYVSKNWQYGMREAISYAENNAYNCVFVSDTFWRPYIYILFYSKYPPIAHQQSPINPALETGHSYSIGNKYNVISLTDSQKIDNQCLFIIKSDEIKEIAKQSYQLKEIKNIKTPGGIEQIRLLEARLESNQ